MDAKLLGRRIAAARKLADMTRDQLAEEIDYSKDQLGAFERGDTSPRHPVIRDIARATGQPEVFFTDEYDGLLAALEQQFQAEQQDGSGPK